MSKRYLSIWLPHLRTDREVRRQPALQGGPFVLAAPERGRMIVQAANAEAQLRGVQAGMVVADSRAILPELRVLDSRPEGTVPLLNGLAEWCLRFTPRAAIDPPDGLLLDASGCSHLWGGEGAYLGDIIGRLGTLGYDARGAMADTIGAARAVARHGLASPIIEPGGQAAALRPLPAVALRLEAELVAKLRKLGLHHIGSFMDMPRAALRRRFGTALLQRLDEALGAAQEPFHPVIPQVPFSERLPCLEPIRTATGIGIALRQLLEALCARMAGEEQGARACTFSGYRMDGNIQQISIGTARPSRNAEHLFRLFDQKIGGMEPNLGFELFVLEATQVEALSPLQDMLWNTAGTGDEAKVAELLDRLAGKLGMQSIHRYLPDEHYWPERSYRQAGSLQERPRTAWRTDRPRPVHLLPRPEPIEVTVPLPDYPPMLFRYRDKLCRVARADGPERIEGEWWLEEGKHRDYYCVEDEAGARYWVFRLGDYRTGDPQWFMHGFFA